MPSARISLTLFRPPPPSFIAFGRSSELHPVSTQSFCMKVRAGRPAFARPCEGVHRSILLITSSLVLQLCPVFLACLTLIVFVMGGKWSYRCCFVGCCHQDLFHIARSIPVSFPSSLFSIRFVSVHVVPPLSGIPQDHTKSYIATITLGMVWTILSIQLWIVSCFCHSRTSIVGALNIPRGLLCH